RITEADAVTIGTVSSPGTLTLTNTTGDMTFGLGTGGIVSSGGNITITATAGNLVNNNGAFTNISTTGTIDLNASGNSNLRVAGGTVDTAGIVGTNSTISDTDVTTAALTSVG